MILFSTVCLRKSKLCWVLDVIFSPQQEQSEKDAKLKTGKQEIGNTMRITESKRQADATKQLFMMPDLENILQRLEKMEAETEQIRQHWGRVQYHDLNTYGIGLFIVV